MDILKNEALAAHEREVIRSIQRFRRHSRQDRRLEDERHLLCNIPLRTLL